METYAQVLTYAIPGFVLLIILEYVISVLKGIKVNEPMDTISSLSSGMTNTLKDLLGIAVVIISYSWMYDHLALLNIESTLILYSLCFVLVDLASYWSHRFNHEINVMWNRHVVHHSSEEFNLSCALRQSISGIFQVYFFLSIPMALVGIPPNVIAVVAPLHLFAQFWYHTRLVNRMGWLEAIIVTPSHHRVHHAINKEYIDKNFAAIFIIWDKLFGTFMEEDPAIRPVYGVKKPVRTWNPFIINYQHMYMLILDCIRAERFLDKIKVWFMPTGWRPADVALKYPISIIEEPETYVKYNPVVPTGLQSWSWIQLITHNVILFYLLTQISEISPTGIMLYSIFLAISIFAYTSLMDLHQISLLFELVKFCLGIFILLRYDWFGLTSQFTFLSVILYLYLFVSLVMNIYYIGYQRQKVRTVSITT